METTKDTKTPFTCKPIPLKFGGANSPPKLRGGGLEIACFTVFFGPPPKFTIRGFSLHPLNPGVRAYRASGILDPIFGFRWVWLRSGLKWLKVAYSVPTKGSGL